MVRRLHSLHELRLAAYVQVIAARFHARGDHRLAIEAKGAHAVEDEPGLGAEAAEGWRVGGIRGEDRNSRWGIGVGGPF